MNNTGAVDVRRHRVTFWAIVAAGGVIAIALGYLATASMRTAAIKAQGESAQNARVEPAAPSKDEIVPATFEIKPSPVIEPDPAFFIGAGDGSSGYYAERPAR
jgi:hypothetical protein